MAASVIDFDGALAYKARRPHSSWRNRPRRESLYLLHAKKTDNLWQAIWADPMPMLSLHGIFSWRDLLLNSFMAVCCSTYATHYQRTKDKRGSHLNKTQSSWPYTRSIRLLIFPVIFLYVLRYRLRYNSHTHITSNHAQIQSIQSLFFSFPFS